MRKCGCSGVCVVNNSWVSVKDGIVFDVPEDRALRIQEARDAGCGGANCKLSVVGLAFRGKG